MRKRLLYIGLIVVLGLAAMPLLGGSAEGPSQPQSDECAFGCDLPDFEMPDWEMPGCSMGCEMPHWPVWQMPGCPFEWPDWEMPGCSWDGFDIPGGDLLNCVMACVKTYEGTGCPIPFCLAKCQEKPPDGNGGGGGAQCPAGGCPPSQPSEPKCPFEFPDWGLPCGCGFELPEWPEWEMPGCPFGGEMPDFEMPDWSEWEMPTCPVGGIEMPDFEMPDFELPGCLDGIEMPGWDMPQHPDWMSGLGTSGGDSAQPKLTLPKIDLGKLPKMSGGSLSGSFSGWTSKWKR